ncbi:MAG: hypothetical protein AB8G14_08200 [Ilumatobacter sp.]
MGRGGEQRSTVAVLDPEGPPGVAFIRSLGRRGVTMVAYSESKAVAGRWSRAVARHEHSPGVHDAERYLAWLTDMIGSGAITHVAPTSDYTVYATAIARQRAGVQVPAGGVSFEAAWACLHKPTFDRVAAKVGFAPVPAALPTSIDEAIVAAAALGYPLVIKPRTHIGVGIGRGAIVHDEHELRTHFARAEVDPAHGEALALDPDLAWPMLQRFIASAGLEVVSVSGCLSAGGAAMHVGHTSKLAQWPPGLGVGSLFESRRPEVHTELALKVVEQALGAGLFELELAIDRHTGEAWPIDLNPRAYGQVALEVARGNDLPGAWFELATGRHLEPFAVRDPLPELWVSAMAHHPGALIGLLRGPQRRAELRRLRTLLGRPRVGSVADRRDPIPGLVMGLQMLRHPGSLVRPFLRRR